MEELIDNTTYEWVTKYKGSEINGGKFTAKKNGAVFFLPAAGYCEDGIQDGVDNVGCYWCSSPDGSSLAFLLNFVDGSKDVYGLSREGGYSVRPVIG